MKLHNLIVAAAILAVVFILGGCNDKDATTKLTVTYATLKYVEGAGDPVAQAARAQRVREIAEQVQQVAKGDSVTVALLQAYVEGKLPSDLSPADRFLASALLVAVASELQARVGDGVLDPDKLLVVDKLLGYVIDATGYFGSA